MIFSSLLPWKRMALEYSPKCWASACSLIFIAFKQSCDRFHFELALTSGLRKWNKVKDCWRNLKTIAHHHRLRPFVEGSHWHLSPKSSCRAPCCATNLWAVCESSGHCPSCQEISTIVWFAGLTKSLCPLFYLSTWAAVFRSFSSPKFHIQRVCLGHISRRSEPSGFCHSSGLDRIV